MIIKRTSREEGLHDGIRIYSIYVFTYLRISNGRRLPRDRVFEIMKNSLRREKRRAFQSWHASLTDLQTLEIPKKDKAVFKSKSVRLHLTEKTRELQKKINFRNRWHLSELLIGVKTMDDVDRFKGKFDFNFLFAAASL